MVSFTGAQYSSGAGISTVHLEGKINKKNLKLTRDF